MALPPNPIFESVRPQQAQHRLHALAAALQAQHRLHALAAPLNAQLGGGAGDLPNTFEGIPNGPNGAYGPSHEPDMGFHHFHEPMPEGVNPGGPREPGPIGSRGIGYEPPIRRLRALAAAVGQPHGGVGHVGVGSTLGY